MKPSLSIYYSNADTWQGAADEKMMFGELVQLAKSHEMLKRLGKYRTVNFYCGRFTAFPKPFLTAVLCRILTLGPCNWIDAEGQVKRINLPELCRLFGTFLYERCTYRQKLRQVDTELDSLQRQEFREPVLILENSPVYIYCNAGYGYIAGGSIGHIAGVLNNLEPVTGHKPVFLTTDIVPTVDPGIESHMIHALVPYGNISDISKILYNKAFFEFLERETAGEKLSFVYQRYILNSYAGLQFAIRHNLPFVMEYNSSEVWVALHWGRRKLFRIDLSEKIETLMLSKATLITCVSQPLKDQLIEKGIEAGKIIVTPNGVNPQMYRPDIDAGVIRQRLKIGEDKVVVGFIGTFGPWHGADVLARAFVACLRRPEWKDRLRLLMVGSGKNLPLVKEILSDPIVEGKYSLPGVVPQAEGPSWLAACDILCAPTVPNSDGSQFFGSPTKLFEYMAMGKAIVASRIAQAAELLDEGINALMTAPGSVDELEQAILRLAADGALRAKLGAAARQKACEEFTWEKRVQSIYDALKDRVKKG